MSGVIFMKWKKISCIYSCQRGDQSRHGLRTHSEFFIQYVPNLSSDIGQIGQIILRGNWFFLVNTLLRNIYLGLGCKFWL